MSMVPRNPQAATSLLTKKEVELLKIYMEENKDRIGKSIVKLRRYNAKPGKSNRVQEALFLKDGRVLNLSHSVIFDNHGHAIVLGEKVGEGTFGKGKRAEFVNFERPGERGATAFVKVVKKAFSEVKEKFDREARGQKKVGRFFGTAVRESADKGYIIIPDEGENLHEYVNKNLDNLTIGKMLNIAILMAEDLKKRFHDKNILHRDLKLGNATFNKETGEVRIIDIGTWVDLNKARKRAKVPGNDPREKLVELPGGQVKFHMEKTARNLFKIRGNDSDEFYIPATLDRIQRVVTTASTAAPEVARIVNRDFVGDIDEPQHHGIYSKKSDVFSLGAEFRNILMLDDESNWTNLERSHPHLRREMKEILDKMTHPDPSKRYSIEESMIKLYDIRQKRDLAMGRNPAPIPNITPGVSTFSQTSKAQPKKTAEVASAKGSLAAGTTAAKTNVANKTAVKPAISNTGPGIAQIVDTKASAPKSENVVPSSLPSIQPFPEPPKIKATQSSKKKIKQTGQVSQTEARSVQPKAAPAVQRSQRRSNPIEPKTARAVTAPRTQAKLAKPQAPKTVQLVQEKQFLVAKKLAKPQQVGPKPILVNAMPKRPSMPDLSNPVAPPKLDSALQIPPQKLLIHSQSKQSIKAKPKRESKSSVQSFNARETHKSVPQYLQHKTAKSKGSSSNDNRNKPKNPTKH